MNNRNPNWEYDADGRLTNGDDIQSTFDAAGQATRVVSNAGNHTQTRSFDGDGRQSKLIEVLTADDGSGNMVTTTTTRYSVSLTVIGKVITEGVSSFTSAIKILDALHGSLQYHHTRRLG